MRTADVDSYRPSYSEDGPPPMPADVANVMYHFGNGRNKPQQDFSFRSRRGPKPASERKLLTTNPTTERPVLGLGHEVDRFKNIDDMTDSEEEDMEDSSDEDEGRSRAKRLKLEENTAGPKWSNPDPYTSLPPPTESAGKGRSVISLIRKARIEAAMDASNLPEGQDDFIPFGDAEDYADVTAPANAPTGPKADRSKLPSRDDHVSSVLGKRKRETNQLLGRVGRQFHADGAVLHEWRAQEGVQSTPWLEACDEVDPPVVALHKEIIDFYEWLRPRDFEFDIRGDVVGRISRSLNRMQPGELKAFGSYAAGLYLPTGDMDLVYITRRPYAPGGLNVPPTKNTLYRFRDFIERQGLARPGSGQVIPSAKVPIIKFVEAESGLKVDLSFNNDSGLIAIDTFNQWKSLYPSMPIIVSLVKQFLMIRGLNDVSVGGLGGFSVICLVTSIIQHLPTGKIQNLGEILLEFFNVYGNLLDRSIVGIRLDPPSYIDKRKQKLLVHGNEKADRLMIIDPNRPDNNVSGGSHEIQRIFSCFSKAHDILQQRLNSFRNGELSNGRFSFLEDLVGGNFSAYDMQREVLKTLRYGRSGQSEPASVSRAPPSQKLTPPNPVHPSPSMSAQLNGRQIQQPKNDGSSGAHSNVQPTAQSKPMLKSERRLARIRRCRPDIAELIKKKNEISLAEALKIGGWADGLTMERELSNIERTLATQQSAP